MRKLIFHDPYSELDTGRSWIERGRWPAHWIACPQVAEPPFVTAFKRTFELATSACAQIHVSADERYRLFLDGEWIGNGPERGDRRNWFFETYELPLLAGRHTLVALVWALGGVRPWGQITVQPGFMCAATGEWLGVLGTGVARWESRRVDGIAFEYNGPNWMVGPSETVDASLWPWGIENGVGDEWEPAKVLSEGYAADTTNGGERFQRLRPALLPPMLSQPRRAVPRIRSVKCGSGVFAETAAVTAADEKSEAVMSWQALFGGQALELPVNTECRVIVDLDDYVCAYPVLTVSGGRDSAIKLAWAESLFIQSAGETKGNRDEIDGKYFVGGADCFLPDGLAARRFTTLWWRPGRYVEIRVQTRTQPLTIAAIGFTETRYPFDPEICFQADDPRLTKAVQPMVRALQMCMHETYMDCPYYEQLMYIGDTRLEVLVTYVLTNDDRLPRKALEIFHQSMLPSGLTLSCHPSRGDQVIPPFSLWWIGMLYDFMMWRDDPHTVAKYLPTVRRILDAFMACIDRNGLLRSPEGWNFMDWVPAWPMGVPAGGGDGGFSSMINWQLVWILQLAAELEEAVGEPELAGRFRRRAEELATTADSAFWSNKRGLYADDLRHEHFSEHAQCLALLSGMVPSARRVLLGNGLCEDRNLSRTTIYFSHYLFETYRLLDRADLILDRMGLWFGLRGQGFRTTPEQPEPSRSDCHAWGAHPLYHYKSTLLGVRPAAPCFREVLIEPHPGPLTVLKGTVPHPQGSVVVEMQKSGEMWEVKAELPPGISGIFRFNGNDTEIAPGRQWSASCLPAHTASESVENHHECE